MKTNYGPGDEVTWPRDPAATVDLDGDNIRDVLTRKCLCDPVGRDFDALMSLMWEESPLDDGEALDAAIVYLTQHMNDEGFPSAVHDVLDAAFQSIANQTDIHYELLRSRQRRAIEQAEAVL